MGPILKEESTRFADALDVRERKTGQGIGPKQLGGAISWDGAERKEDMSKGEALEVLELLAKHRHKDIK